MYTTRLATAGMRCCYNTSLIHHTLLSYQALPHGSKRCRNTTSATKFLGSHFPHCKSLVHAGTEAEPFPLHKELKWRNFTTPCGISVPTKQTYCGNVQRMYHKCTISRLCRREQNKLPTTPARPSPPLLVGTVAFFTAQCSYLSWVHL